jgi:hypothetical protein
MKHTNLLFLFFLFVIFSLSCRNERDKYQKASDQKTVFDSAISGEHKRVEHPNESKSTIDLKWGKFITNPVKSIVDQAYIIRGLDFLVLYYALRGKPWDVNEFSNYFSDYKISQNEFERRRVSEVVIQSLNDMKAKLLSSTLCLRIDDMMIGEYNFKKRGFPLLQRTGYMKTHEEIKNYETFVDSSNSGIEILLRINTRGSVFGMSYSCVNSILEIDNLTDHGKFPAFIHVSEDLAELVSNEFGHGEDKFEKMTAAAFGDKYEGYRTAVGYVIFTPKKAKTKESMMEGVSYNSKEIHGQANYLVLATERGTVFGVYP